MDIENRTNLVKNLAFAAGFDLVKITGQVIADKDISRFNNWLSLGNAASMDYMFRNRDLRESPDKLFPELKSIIVLALSYNITDKPDTQYKVSKYAFGRDYHKLIKRRMKQLDREIRKHFPNFKSRSFVDSAPVLERSLALQSGLGWIGKNTCLINKEMGSFIFLSEMFTNIELQFDISEFKDFCGNCTRCIDACPTQALSINGLDANKCISYHTIESKETIPEHILEAMDNQIFGCDICQDVCPWNKNKPEHDEQDLLPCEHLSALNYDTLLNMSDDEFMKTFGGTPFYRTGREKLLKTIEQINRFRKR
jgi:epoxyqueuosine reductase